MASWVQWLNEAILSIISSIASYPGSSRLILKAVQCHTLCTNWTKHYTLHSLVMQTFRKTLYPENQLVFLQLDCPQINWLDRFNIDSIVHADLLCCGLPMTHCAAIYRCYTLAVVRPHHFDCISYESSGSSFWRLKKNVIAKRFSGDALNEGSILAMYVCTCLSRSGMSIWAHMHWHARILLDV